MQRTHLMDGSLVMIDRHAHRVLSQVRNENPDSPDLLGYIVTVPLFAVCEQPNLVQVYRDSSKNAFRVMQPAQARAAEDVLLYDSFLG